VNVVLGALSFAVFAAAPSMMLSATILYTQTPRRPSAFDDFLVVVYYAGVTTAVSTVGFLIPTGLSQQWRLLSKTKTTLIAGGLGLISPVVFFVVLMFTAVGLNALFKSSYMWLGLVIGQGLPGLILGTFAHYAARYFVHWDRKIERSGQ
jgi:hypothetical protein